MSTDTLKVEAQAALDELMQEHELPFSLEAQNLADDGAGRYTLRFYDSRLHSVTVEWAEGQSFKDVIRVAVLDRVAKLSGPLNRKKH